MHLTGQTKLTPPEIKAFRWQENKNELGYYKKLKNTDTSQENVNNIVEKFFC